MSTILFPKVWNFIARQLVREMKKRSIERVVMKKISVVTAIVSIFCCGGISVCIYGKCFSPEASLSTDHKHGTI